MKKQSSAIVGFSADVCLRAAVMLALAAALFVACPRALAARYPEHHLMISHRVVHRLAVQSTGGRAASPKSSRSKSKSDKNNSQPHNAARPVKPLPKAKRRRLRPQDEADNDPVVLHRAQQRKPHRTPDARRAIAGRTDRDEQKPAQVSQAAVAAEGNEFSEDVLIAKRRNSVVDMTRPDTFEPRQSHPDDDQRLTVQGNQQNLAIVAAISRPSASTTKLTVPQSVNRAAGRAEKLDMASPGATVSPRKAAKPSVFPEDHAGRVAVIDAAMTPMVLPTLRTQHGRLVMPAPLKGSRDILVHQNTMADSEGLDRIQDDDDLDRLRAQHLLVPLKRSSSLLVNEELPLNRRYARPWTARFAADTAQAFYVQFRKPLKLNSAVRTVEYQLRLQRVNGNAAAVDGDGASPHLTGQALDFGKRGMSMAQLAWMRAYLAPLMQAGKVDVEEEFQQACFHISVYPGYMPAIKPKPKTMPKVEVAQAHAELPIPGH